METTKHDEEFLTLDHPVTASAGGTTWRTTQSKHNQLDTYQMYGTHFLILTKPITA